MSVFFMGCVSFFLTVFAHAQPPARLAGECKARDARRERANAGKMAGKVSAAPHVPTKNATKLSAAELDRLGMDLLSPDYERVEAAAARLAELGTPEALDRLLEVLALGLVPQRAPALLDAVGKIKDPKSVQMLELYSGNINLKVRLAAVRGLVKQDGPRVNEILVLRLGDPEAEVRAAAAEALAERKEAAAVDRLYALLRRGDAGAAGPLGQLAPLELAPRVAELRGTIPDGALASALGEFLKRPGAPERLRLDLVRTLGQLPGADATTALVEYVGTLPESETPPSKSEAQRLIDQRGNQ